MKRWLAIALLALTGALALPAGASEPVREFDTPEQRERYYSLLEQLRCLVCQNESLASSSADLAQDMRDEVYRLAVEENRSEGASITFLTERYGDFVLYRPPVGPSTWLLWFGPALMLLIGSAILATIVRWRRNDNPSTTLSPVEQARAEQLLASNNEDER